MTVADIDRIADRVRHGTGHLDRHDGAVVALATASTAVLTLGAGEALAAGWLSLLADGPGDAPDRVRALLDTAGHPGVLRPLTRGLDGTGAGAAVSAVAAVLGDVGPAALADLDRRSPLLGTLYTNLRSPAGKQAGGAFYTPSSLADLMASMVGTPPPGTTISDPCCGAGVQLVTAARRLRARGLDPNDWTFAGNDLDPVAAALCLVNLVAAGVRDPVVTVGDALARTGDAA